MSEPIRLPLMLGNSLRALLPNLHEFVKALRGYFPIPGEVEEAKFEELGPVEGYEVRDNFLEVRCGRASLRIYVVSPKIIRVRLAPDGEFPEKRSYAVVKEVVERVEFSVEDKEGFIELSTPALRVRVEKRPCRVVFLDPSGEVVCADYKPPSWAPSQWEGYRVRCLKKLFPDEHFYGFGEKAGKLDKRRRRLVMWNYDSFDYKEDTDPLYLNVPFFIALRKGRAYGILFDNSYRAVFDMGHSSEEYYSFEAEGGELDYYFIYGPSVKEVLEGYTELTGRMPLPQLWALGHQQCRYSYYPQSRVLEVARRYREERIPCDVIYLDIHYMDGYRVFTWNEERFPDPKGMCEELARMGFKVVTIVDPGIKLDPRYGPFREGVVNDYFCKYPNGDLYVGRVWPGLCAFPDFTKPEVRRWWGDLHKVLVEAGVAGIWNDMNEPSIFATPTGTMDEEVVHADGPHAKVHNVYALLEAQATYEGLLRLRPGRRPFVLTRAGFAGIQRYAAKWTGDNRSNWLHLWLQIPMVLGLGLSGIPFAGSDVGGFVGRPTAELLVRWYQVEAFFPLCRNHQSIGTYDHEPWMFGERAKRIIREVLRLRYRLLPYMYNLFYEHYVRGYPVVRPLLFEFEDDEETYDIDDEFMLGGWLLVAPVLREGARSREVYLPRGRWYDFWSDEVYEGPGYFAVEAPLEKVPVFVRAGAILPMWPDMLYVGERDPDPLYLHVYPGESASSLTLYEDDGETLAYRDGEYCLTEFRYEPLERGFRFVVGERRGRYAPRRRFIVFADHRAEESRRVVEDGVELKPLSSLEEEGEGYLYDREKRILYVKLRDTGRRREVLIEAKP